MHFSCHSVSALDAHLGKPKQVGHEVPLGKLIDLLLDQHHLKGAESLDSLKLLHVQDPEAGAMFVER
jgi:hypothetical protein